MLVDTIPLKEDYIPLKEDNVPLKEDNVPLKEDYIPLKEDYVPLKEDNVPRKEDYIPLKEDYIPLKEDNKRGIMSRQLFLISGKGVFYSTLRIFQQPPAKPPLLYIIARFAAMVSFFLILPFNK